MRKFYVFLFICLAVINFVNAQTTIQLDRPDQTECPFIVPEGYLQVENGFTFEHETNQKKNYSYPSSLWKLGINERLEIRLITEFIKQKIDEKSAIGLAPVTVGFKANIFSENGILPLTSFIGHISTSNIGTKKFHSTFIAPSFRFVMQNTITQKLSLSYNLGAEWNGETSQPTYLYTVSLANSFGHRLGGYVELYGFLTKSTANEHCMDGGFTYLLSNDFVVDVSAGIGLSKDAPKYYTSLGVSFRIKTRKK